MTSRREAWGLTLISGLFVIAGLFLVTVVGAVAIGAVSILFFGAGLIVGTSHLVSTRRGGLGRPTGPLGLLVVAAASFLLGVACLLFALFAVLDWQAVSSPGRSPVVAALAGVAGTVFFGGGSGILVVRAVVARRRQDG